MRKRFRGFVTLNLARPGMRKTFVFLCLGTAIIFAFLGAITMLQAQKSMTPSEIGRVTSHITPRTLLMVMGEDIPYLKEQMESIGMEKVLARMIFEMMTSLDLRDPRTFLGHELPQFALFDSEIDLAASDVDYTALPIESPPPPELEQEIIKAMEKPDQELNHVDTGTIKEKKVIVYNTHFWESYLPDLKKKNPREASDLNKNITLVSKHMVEVLEKMGVGAVATHKKYTWNGAYQQSRKLVQSVMAEHKEATYLIDLHRDSRRRNITTKEFDGKTYARLAFVVGKSSKNYEQNLRLAREMHNRINEIIPGLSRAVIEKDRTEGNGEYNQSLSPNAMLVEVGGVDNTFEEAYRSVEILARVIAERIHQVQPVMGSVEKR